jgi:hypothetical protein
VAGDSDQARRYGEESLQLCRDHHLDPSYLAYVHEALARAAAVAGHERERDLHKASAEQAAGQIDSESNREAVLRDLATI